MAIEQPKLGKSPGYDLIEVEVVKRFWFFKPEVLNSIEILNFIDV